MIAQYVGEALLDVGAVMLALIVLPFILRFAWYLWERGNE